MRIRQALIPAAIGTCFLLIGNGLALAQAVERLPEVVNLLSPPPNEVRQLPTPKTSQNFSPTSRNFLPTSQNFPPSVLGPKRPIGNQIKVIRIPDLYGQCPTDQGEPLDLCRAISCSASNNPILRQAQADVANAKAGKTVAFSPFLPNIRAENQLYKSSNPLTSIIYGGLPTIESPELNIAQIKAEWIIWDFGRTLGSYRQSDILLKIARLRCAKAGQMIGYKTADAYFQVLIGKASVRVADDSIQRSEEYLRVANNLYHAGKIDSEGVLSAQLDLVHSQQLMVDAIARRQIAVAGLNNVLGLRLLETACVRDVEGRPDFSTPLENCIQTGLIQRPEMCVVKNEMAYAIQQCRIAQSKFKPRATANGNFTNVTGDFETDFWEGAVQLEWDLFAGGSRVGLTREAQAAMARAKAHAHEIRDNVIYEVSQSYEQLRAARHQLTLSRAAITVAQEKRRIVLDKFQVGKASPTDVIEAQTQLTTAEQDYYTAIYRLHIAIADLNYQMGNIACCPPQ